MIQWVVTLKAKYLVIFDPLDGSSNIDINVSVGTIFSILELPEGAWTQTKKKLTFSAGRKQDCLWLRAIRSIFSILASNHRFTALTSSHWLIQVTSS